MLFKEITAVYSENHMKPINILHGKMQSFNVKATDTGKNAEF
jgi:hypothetical protein